MRILTLVFILIFMQFSPAFAVQDEAKGSGLPLPRFASLKSDSVFARTGPSMEYPIRWIYKREGLPVEIIQEFDVWRKIKDPSGQTGWVHKILLSGNRTVIVNSKENVMAYAEDDGTKPVAKLEDSVIARVGACEEKFCKLELMPFEGWVQKKFLWGVYPAELLN
jgi:SH3-like domain-containing protein